MLLEGGLPSGRERAIETLIDMEPHGAMHRAARVLDEVVPQTLLNRPNVVTKAALVEQANSLSEHEINAGNYDKIFASEVSFNKKSASNTHSTMHPRAPSSRSAHHTVVGARSSASSSALTKVELILRHHAKQCNTLQKQKQQREHSNNSKEHHHHAPSSSSGNTFGSISSASNSTATTPAPQLVAVLRQIYGTTSALTDDSSAFSFPTLLKAVMNHNIFEVQCVAKPKAITAADDVPISEKTTSISASTTEPETSNGSSSSAKRDAITGNNDETLTASAAAKELTVTGNKEDHSAPVAPVESLVANVCRLAALDGDTNKEKDKDLLSSNSSLLQGLLVAALSVLTNPEKDSFLDENDGIRGTGNNANKSGNSKSIQHTKDRSNTSTVTDQNKGAVSRRDSNSSQGSSGSSVKQKEAATVDVEDPSTSPALCVGSILSLLKLEGKSIHRHMKEGYQLDQELVDYFAEAAAAYENRIEVQEARLLVKSQHENAVVEPDTATTVVAATAATTSTLLLGGDSGVAGTSATTPTVTATTASGDGAGEDNGVTTVPIASTPMETNRNGGDIYRTSVIAAATTTSVTEQVAVLEGEATDHLDRLAEANLTTATALEQIAASAAMGDETSNDRDEDADFSSASDSNAEDVDADEAEADGRNFRGGGENRDADEDAHDGLNGSPATDDEGDAQEEDEDESSSSSSGNDWAMMEDRAAGSDGDQGNGNGDNGEADALRQALALSLSEHSSSRVSSETAAMAQSDRDHAAPSTTSTGDITNGFQAISEGQQLMEIPTKSESDCGDDGEQSLPPLPVAPIAHSYATLLGHPLELDSEQTDATESALAPYLDPSVFANFASIPTANVLVHLLRYTAGIIEQSRYVSSTSTTSGAYSETTIASIPGGIGLSLFPPIKQDAKSSFVSSEESESSNAIGMPVTLHLLIAFFLQIMHKRDEAVGGLRNALAQEARKARGEDVAEETIGREHRAQREDSPLTSGEEDDPAIALAMNHAEDSVAESSESLEAKGMLRKAAAAAHDAAAVLVVLRRRTDAWKQSVKLYSLCAAYALRNLRLFLQFNVQQSLSEVGPQKKCSRISFDCEFLPAVVRSKLSVALASLLSINANNVSLAMSDDDESEFSGVLLALDLYKEGVATWGECVPLIYPTTSAKVEILRNLIAECSPASGVETSPHVRKLESLTRVPSTEMERQVHKLQILCKRLRVADILDDLIPGPGSYVQSAQPAKSAAGSDTGLGKAKTREPFRASQVVSLLATETKDVCGGKGELQRLFLSICHRFHSRVLLWDGFYETSESDVDVVARAAVAQSPACSGDLVRIGAKPSSTLQFDATKCSDSIAILGESSSAANGSSVHQRASKVWGTVLSTQWYSPSSGIFSFSVRLDKCERGHVFVGVATAQASMRTYVGGDKFGWGMIGTQALWHDRRKIRGDYGATFRTGSTIVVTLDTNAGTLSFSSWKDSSAPSAFSLDPLLQNQPASRRQSYVGGTVEDWGVAFEGLPLDSRLYPAVGLYQRDDRVTLLTVESMRNTERDGGIGVPSGVCFYPVLDSFEDTWRAEAAAKVRCFNDALSWEGIQYVLGTLQLIERCLEEDRDEFVVTALLPSLSAALCLVPNSIPILSERLALTLLPRLSKFLMQLDGFRRERQMDCTLFRSGVKPGKWIIRATGSSGDSNDFEEYLVDLSLATSEEGVSIGFEGTGVGTTGKSKNGLVAIFGTTNGSSLHFIEEWSDGSGEGFGSAPPEETSSCVVAAHLSLDGAKFEGTYRNVQFGTSGQITGILRDNPSSIPKFCLKDAPTSSKQSAVLADGIATGEAVLCLAFNHMATIISEDAAGDQLVIKKAVTTDDKVAQQAHVKRLLSNKLLQGSSLLMPGDGAITEQLKLLRQQYAWKKDLEDCHNCRQLVLLETAALDTSVGVFGTSDNLLSNDEIETTVAALYERIVRESGSSGSLRGICPDAYDNARKHIICSFIRPCHLEGDIASLENSECRLQIGRASLTIMEDGLRQAILEAKEGESRKEACINRCNLNIDVSNFLCSLEFSDVVSPDDAVSDMSHIYRTVEKKEELDILQKEMKANSRRSLLRLISAQALLKLSLTAEKSSRTGDNLAALESLVHGLPRVLGRSPTDSLTLMRNTMPSRPGTRPAQDSQTILSAGIDRLTRQALKDSTLKLFNVLVETAACAVSRRSKLGASESVASVDSLILSVLTVFTVILRDDCAYEVVSQSNILNVIKDVLAQHAGAIRASNLLQDEQVPIVKKLQEVCQREISRSVLGASVAAAHAIVFQTSHRTSKISRQSKDQSEKQTSIRLSSYDFLFGEIAMAIECASKFVSESNKLALTRKKDEDWKRWCHTNFISTQTLSQEKRSKSRQMGTAGLFYLQENGIAQSLGNPQKSSSRQKNNTGHASSKTSEGVVDKFQSVFAFQILSQWLHILCGVLNIPTALSLLSSDSKWITLLLGAAGLNAGIGPGGAINSVLIEEPIIGHLPARFRSRIVRFLLPLLGSMEPNVYVIRGLVKMAGSSIDEAAKFVSREAVTLLRRLHSPTRPSWRKSINRTITTEIKDHSEGIAFQLGVLAFLSGSLESIGHGSYVLLKPAAAVPLSVDQHSSSPSKGNSSGIGGTGSAAGATPHHIVGNGTEGVVAGLCRHNASAGLVSSIDMKNGICEVVLLTRDPVEPDESSESLLISKMDGGTTPNARQSLTVRALRTALSDVAHAQEAPLFLDETITFENLLGSLVEPALQTLFSVMGNKMSLGSIGKEKEKNNAAANLCEHGDLQGFRSGLMHISSAIMLLRSTIVVLSDKRITSEFLKSESSKSILSKILQLALPNEIEDCTLSNDASKAQKYFLSSLPVHEARYGYLMSMLSEVSARAGALATVSASEWTKRMKIIHAHSQASSGEKEEEPKGGSSTSEGPPVESASTSSRTQNAATRGLSTGSAGSAVPAATANITDSASNRAISQSTAGSNSDDDDEEENEAAATAAAHLREAAIAQMAELGLPRSWSEFALRRTGGDIEAAVHFLLENGGEMERLLADERERDRPMQAGAGQSTRRGGQRSESRSSNHLLTQLQEMGFPSRWCAEALAATGNNVDEALTWILTHGERLSEEDEALDDDENVGDDVDDDEDEEDGEDDEEDDYDGGGSESAPRNAGDTASALEEYSDGSAVQAWSGSIVPLRFISGRSIIDPKTLTISGLPTGGFSSVGTKGVLLCSGKWYYEAILDTAGCLQIGWADGSFAGHCHADRGDGTGDGPSSWAFDGWRRYRWHSTATEWGCCWQEGDVIGCMVDMDERKISFTLNGRAEEIGMGVAFSGEGFRPCGGVYACVSFNRREKLRLKLTEPFTHQPPPGYRGVGIAVLEAVKERQALAEKEQILDYTTAVSETESGRFLCDFSDGEHGHELMAWAHRYYGSDASVHLGSGRSKQPSGIPKTAAASITESPAVVCVIRRLEKAWALSKKSRKNTYAEAIGHAEADEIVSNMTEGYIETSRQLDRQILDECVVLAVLFARKLILHLIVTLGEDFDLSCFLADDAKPETNARRFWEVIDTCASLRCAGWVGEAGAMAIAAEALGLGISSNDHTHSRHNVSERAGMAMVPDLDEGVQLPAGGVTQLLSSVMRSDTETNALETGSLLAACAETAIGSDGGGGVLVFIQRGLQSAACRSPELRRVLAAAVTRSIRLLAVVEYEGDDSDTSDQMEADDVGDTNNSVPSVEKNGKDGIIQERMMQPDARLTSFLTGLLMSKPVEAAVSRESYVEILQDLFQAWSIGMLSASLPWRMVCAFTVAGILSKYPTALKDTILLFPTLARFYGRLESTVCRRVWAERAAVPVCSRYAQAMIELLASVKRAVSEEDMPDEFMKFWGKVSVDAATPLPLDIPRRPAPTAESNWESDDGWVSSDTSWEVWTGTVNYLPLDWETPSRSPVRSLMDGGEGPPMLREGCFVIRGLDWLKTGSGAKEGNEDGKKSYEAEKVECEKEKRRAEEEAKEEEVRISAEGDPAVSVSDEGNSATASDPTTEPTTTCSDPAAMLAADRKESALAPVPASTEDERSMTVDAKKKQEKKKKFPSPKLPVGTVISVEPWNGQPGLGRRVRWHLTKKEGVYRYGGDGGRYDISHVEINEKHTRVKKRHPLPESAEQCSSRHGFGANKKYNIVLRTQRLGSEEWVDPAARFGILEWPDFGAGVRVVCSSNGDGSITVTEKELLYGAKDSGWEARFGQPSFVSGSSFTLSPTKPSNLSRDEVNTKSPFLSFYEEYLGNTTHQVASLRNRADGGKLEVTSEMRLFRGSRETQTNEKGKVEPVQAPTPPPIHFDRDYHASSLSLSRDGRTVSCVASDGRGAAYASVGFTKGVHYWEVKLEQADIGSVFIGVAEKPNSSGSGGSFDTPPRLNRWPGWGFVNFRATYSSGAERVYGAHCHAGDTVGVLLDCDAGRVSFFFDGLKYGEHILNDLGCAFENLSPFGFNVDGCGSGGAGQGAPSGIEGGRNGRYPAQGLVRPRALWPVIGLRNQGDRVTISPKWMTSYGVDGVTATRNVLAVDEILCSYADNADVVHGSRGEDMKKQGFPEWFVSEAFLEYQRWHTGKWKRTVTRGSGPYKQTSFGLDVDLDASPLACATASAVLGLEYALLAGDRVRLLRSAGRILELAEEALILGTYQGRLYYQIVSQKSEGGSLAEGGGRAWFFDESEVVGGLPFVGKEGKGEIRLPMMDRFTCRSPGGLKIAYDGGAVVRSDLEIIDGSMTLGVIPVGTVIPQKDVLERRVNSCGVTRYRIRAKLGDETKEGWVSSRIRGGKEEPIVEPVQTKLDEKSTLEATELSPKSFPTALSCALAWKVEFDKLAGDEIGNESYGGIAMVDLATFIGHLDKGLFSGVSVTASDSMLVSAIDAISNFSDSGDSIDCSFDEIFSALEFVVSIKNCTSTGSVIWSKPAANQAAAYALASVESEMPPIESIMARAALLRVFNRRARRALPWMSVRPCQEGSAIFGGLCGHGASTERSGRTRLLESQELWVQIPSIAARIRTLRRLFFGSVKIGLLQSITEATATPTPLSHDEYELPREIRTVRINRLRSRMAMAGTDNGAKRKYSVFAQLHNETKGWGGAALRRGYVAKGHGGQRRAFKVKLIGEGVNDYSGPYREAFTDAFSEVLDADPALGRGSLGVLDPTPNKSADLGENRELCMFSLNGRDLSGLKKLLGQKVSAEEKRIWESFSSLTAPRDEPSREVEEALVFLGRLTGTAYRHGIPVDLPLPLQSVWKAIVEEESKSEDRLRELDELAFRQITTEPFSPLLWWQQKMLNSFVEGLSNVLPVEVLSILDGPELRGLMCGNEDVDVDLLRSVVEYEGYVENDAVIQAFWETLRELNNIEKKLFLQFVWARNRLPLKRSDFEAPFKIQRDSTNTGHRADQALPSASTCFFSLALPEYTCKAVLKKKLLFAISNVTTMETDFQTNSAEIAEGYRAF